MTLCCVVLCCRCQEYDRWVAQLPESGWASDGFVTMQAMMVSWVNSKSCVRYYNEKACMFNVLVSLI